MSNLTTRPVILASASPRRLDLLRQIGLEPSAVDAADVDETPLRGELPAAYAQRLAGAKARAISSRHPDRIVLAADTVVVCGRRILPKAGDEADARRCLTLLSGRRHRVLGGVCIIGPEQRTCQTLVTTTVRFKRLSVAETEAYIRSGEWHGKAGGYAIQGRAAAFVAFISGSYSNVVGLPLHETVNLLKGAGWWRDTP
ncbi:MAG: septum formation protein Maf [Alphaproteobacteria bacterium]|nr:septum formation protein Maf [Alphaproteobacteria bacterium]